MKNRFNTVNTIADRAKNITESATLAISATAKKMQEDGKRIINFTVGEPDFNTPDYIICAAKKALDEGKTKYTASAGVLPLRKAICEKLKRDNGLDYNPNQIVTTNGAKQALFNITQALINPGDEVIIPAPYWLTYPELVRLAGGVPIIVETEQNNAFKMTPVQLENALTPRTKAVIINSPNNPTGAVYNEAELRALAAVAEKSGIFVISDEIYENLIYSDTKHWSIAAYSKELFDRTIVINGMSKTYSMTGWRIGYSACNTALASAMERMQSHTTSNVNTMTQHAALEALTADDGKKFLETMVDEFSNRRKYMLKRLETMPYITFSIPEGAFYVMINIGKVAEKTVQTQPKKLPASDLSKQFHDSSQQVAAALLQHAGIAVVPGSAFGAPDYIRLCYTLSLGDIKDGMDALENFLNKLL